MWAKNNFRFQRIQVLPGQLITVVNEGNILADTRAYIYRDTFMPRLARGNYVSHFKLIGEYGVIFIIFIF